STAIQYAAGAGSNGSSSLRGSQKRRKYQEESTNVSIVSVSRRAGPPQTGHFTLTHSGTCASGESPRPVNVVTVGSFTGKSAYGTPTAPSFGQCTIGIGVPQYRWREMPQSLKR